MTHLSILTILVTVATLTRWLVGRASEGTGTDEWFHLLYARAIRRNGHRIPRRLEGFAVPLPFEYPWLLHWALSFVPEERLERAGAWLGALYGAATVIILYATTLRIAGRLEPTLDPSTAGAIAGMVYLVTPVALNRWSGIGKIGERPLGVLLVFLATAGGVLYGLYGDVLDLAVSGLACGLLFLTSQFGVQTLVALFPVVALSTRSAETLAIPVLGWALAAVATGGRSIAILRQQIRNLAFFYRVRRDRFLGITRMNVSVAEALRVSRDAKGLRAALLRLAQSPVLRAILYNPFLILLTVWTAFHTESMPGVLVPFVALVAGTLAMCLLVGSVRALRFIGEADRYLYYGGMLPMATVLGIGYARPAGSAEVWMLGVATLASAGIVFAEVGLRARGGGRRESEAFEASEAAVVEGLAREGVSRVLTIPVGFAAHILYRTAIPTLPAMYLVSAETDEGYYDGVFGDEDPYPRTDLDAIRRRFGVEAVVVYEKYVSPKYRAARGIESRYDLSKCKPIASGPAMTAYVWPDGDPSAGGLVPSGRA